MSNIPTKTLWGTNERKAWLSEQSIKRSYKEEVVDKIQSLGNHLEVHHYGALPIDETRYPLYLVKSKHWDDDLQTVLITGGVHGYETSGVQGAIRFLQDELIKYHDHFNFIVVPCVSPWGYETINRWNPMAIDPNRSFYQASPSDESRLLMEILDKQKTEVFAHFDLHETTDTDNIIFRPALASRDGIEQKNWNIPDGFYLVGDSIKPEPDFQKAMIDSVQKVTHIAPADDSGKIIGEPLEQFGVINYPTKKLGLCAGITNAKYVTTTEVYPDSPIVTDDECNRAQVAAIIGGLDFILSN